MLMLPQNLKLIEFSSLEKLEPRSTFGEEIQIMTKRAIQWPRFQLQIYVKAAEIEEQNRSSST